jgi:hypothetical protein
MTNNKKKLYWMFNWILCAIVFVILAAVFAYRYYSVGYPVEETWTQEVFKYLFMWPILTVICWTIAYVPFRALSSYIAKKNGADDETAGGDK